MTSVRDDPHHPDPGFADLYANLPDTTDLEPWLSLARAARPPVLYLGAGAGRLAVPLARAGIELVLVDAHPGMLEHLRRRLSGAETHLALVEDLDLGPRFDLVIVPSNILDRLRRLQGAARQLAPGGRLAFELTNPHWLAAGGSPRFRVLEMDYRRARIEVDYPGGAVQEGELELVWPDEVEEWLAGAGLELVRLFGQPEAEVAESSTFYIVARAATPLPAGSGS